MNAELQAIRDAMDPDIGRDREQARTLAVAYIDAHPDEFTDLEDMDGWEDVVVAAQTFREAGFETYWWRCEAWLLKVFPAPQVIGGELNIGGGPAQPPTEGGA